MNPFLQAVVLLLVPMLGARAYMVYTLPLDVAIPERAIYQIWSFGLANDALAIAWLCFPLALLALWLPRAVRFALTAVVIVACLVAVLDAFFWFEFGNRVDRLVFHYLAFPVEVMAFLEDQFFISLLIVPVIALILAVHRFLRPLVGRLAAMPRPQWRRIGVVLCAAVLLPIVAAEATPLRPGLSREVNEAASNGLVNAVHAMRMDTNRWVGVFPALDEPTRRALLAAAEPPPRSLRAVPRHLLLVIEESFGGAAWWDAEERARYMPAFDSLRRSGVYFDHLYATGTRTTRGLEALLNGYPPLPGIALNQRPGFERLPSLPRVLAKSGFETLFVYGGWPGFSNFERYWRGIGFHTVLTRDDFHGDEFETSWGVADEFLFDRILAEMDARTRGDARVFLATLTVSNHRPFDFPPGRIALRADERRLENAIAYADWALGQFMAQASSRDWYRDTLFVIVPDHGPRAKGNGLIPVSSFRTPVLMIWPAGLAAGARSEIASAMDLPTTALALLGVAADEGFFGRDLLQNGAGLAPLEHDYRVGVLTDHGLTVLLRDESAVTFTAAESGGWIEGDLFEPDANRAVALFQTAHERWHTDAANAHSANAESNGPGVASE